MTTMEAGAPITDRDLLLGLRGSDWEYLHGREKSLAKEWARALHVHMKFIAFTHGFRDFLAAKLVHSSRGETMLLVATLKRQLHLEEAHAADAEAFRAEMPEHVRLILDLPADRFPMPEWFVHDCRNHSEDGRGEDCHGEDDPHDHGKSDTSAEPATVSDLAVPADETGPVEGPTEESGVAEGSPGVSLSETVDLLDSQRGPLLNELTGLRDDVETGRRPHYPDLPDRISRWVGLWATVPELADTVADARSLAEARDAQAAVLAGDRSLLAQVAGLGFAGGDERAVAAIATVQASAATLPLPLDDRTRVGLAALLAVLNTEWAADSDVQAVADQFGHQVLLAASRLTPASGDPAGAEEIPIPDRNAANPAAQEESSGTPTGEPTPKDKSADQPEPPEPEPDEVEPAESAGTEPETVAGNQPDTSIPADEPNTDEVPSEPEPVAAASAEVPAENTGDAQKRPTAAMRNESPTSPEPAPAAKGPEGTVRKEDYLARFERASTAGEFGWAFWFATAGQDEVRARSARLLVSVTSADMAVGSPNPRADALAARLGTDLVEASASISETIAASLVPAALLLPPYSEAVLSLNTAASRLGNDCPAFIRIANVLTYERGSGLHTVEAPLLLAARDRARSDLEEFKERAASRTIRFHRATEVWRELIRQQGLLGSLVERALTHPGDEQVRRTLADIDGRGIERLIKDTDQQLNPMQAKRQGIIAGAKQELMGTIQRYLDLIRAYVAAEDSVRAIGKDTSLHTDLIADLIGSLPADPAAEADFGPVTIGVAKWLRSRLVPTGSPVAPASEAHALARPLAKAFELLRRADRNFDSSQVTVELLEAQRTRTVEEAFTGYVARHDFVGLEGLLDSVRATQPGLLASLEERERRARSESREALQRALDQTRVGLSRALAVTSLTEAEAQDYQNKLERVSRDPSPHFRETLAALGQIDAELARRQQDRVDAAAKRLAALTEIDEAARRRVEDLLGRRDLLSAEEFLAQLSNGATSLPDEDAGDRTLEEFWPVSAAAAADTAGPHWFADRLAERRVAGLELPHPSAPLRVRDGLVAWERLDREGGRPQGFDQMVREVLQGVGFQQVTLGQRFSRGRFTSYNVFEARYDGYALIPTFGSAARGSYGIFLCWERKTVDGLLQAVRAAQEGQPRPTVVLYFQTLKPAERRQLAEQCRRKELPNIVVDHAAMAYLGTREEARLDALMHVCLPFTGSNPFTPFVLGDVPREMFYGRTDELRQVQDPNGPLFVYGGRQLGKSALLKTALSEFAKFDAHHVAIYLDLKAEGIGEWNKADDLWRVLLPPLQAKGVVNQKVSRQATPAVVVAQVGEWLAGDERRHLLLLLDESDAFLDQDAQPRDSGRGQFKNVYLLKNLMNQSGRRFKPVFAGLHQVQRFHKESNGPMAHVGTEIPVGPLPPAEAYKLVVRPLEAIGYRFANPDVVWRLLSHTNYQASLIQLFCQELVKDLRGRRLGLAEPPSIIDATTVDKVYENKELRGRITQRFEWTIQLDNRYRVIALVAAWLDLTDEAAVFPLPVLSDQCADFWPAGFARVTQDEFRALLDEMVGLGVLVRSRQDHYGIRSPNVIRLLGSKDEVERKLLESSTLELPTVFDPTRYRRRLTAASRSPITEAQAARMLFNASQPTLVTASQALGADRIGQALDDIATSGERIQLFTACPDDLTATLTQMLRMRLPRHLLFDARGIDAETFDSALARLGKATHNQDTFTVSILLGPADRVSFDLPDNSVREVVLEPWSDVELHAVEPEADVPLKADVRAQLLAITGGWPDVIEPVLALGRRRDIMTLLDLAAAEVQKVVDAGWATFADRIGLTRGSQAEQALRALLDWDEPLSRDDLADLLPPWPPHDLTAALDMLVRTAAVQSVTGGTAGPVYRVNPLVARMIKGGQ